jgi:hypothetical protein
MVAVLPEGWRKVIIREDLGLEEAAMKIAGIVPWQNTARRSDARDDGRRDYGHGYSHSEELLPSFPISTRSTAALGWGRTPCIIPSPLC